MTSVLIRSSDGYFWNIVSNAYEVSPLAAAVSVGLIEVGVTGHYVGNIPAGALADAADGTIKVEYYSADPTTYAYNDAVAERETFTVDARGQLVASTTQPRQNKPAGRAFSRSVNSRPDGTHKVSAHIRIREGVVGSIAVSIDMRPLFGSFHVQTVGTPSISTSGEITATAAAQD
ncbi:MAG: hypothetical protein ABGX16_14990 [Pirellulales bacterium]